jgi:hypothetical protein
MDTIVVWENCLYQLTQAAMREQKPLVDEDMRQQLEKVGVVAIEEYTHNGLVVGKV